MPSGRAATTPSLLTMLYRSTDRRCRRGAPMVNLAHSASFHSGDKIVPSNTLGEADRPGRALAEHAMVRHPLPPGVRRRAPCSPDLSHRPHGSSGCRCANSSTLRAAAVAASLHPNDLVDFADRFGAMGDQNDRPAPAQPGYCTPHLSFAFRVDRGCRLVQ